MERSAYLSRIKRAFAVHPVVAILGPRQCGKTTLARMYAKQLGDTSITFFDLEDPAHVARLETPKLALQDLRGLVVIDEVQRAPRLFEVLRVLADREHNPAKFLILGSASRDLIRQSSESLAGRIGYLELTPFTLDEAGSNNLQPLWIRGGYPPSFLAKHEDISIEWRKSYISTYLERDIPALGISIPPMTLRRFWTMLAHYHGQIINYSEIGRSFGVADTTIRKYIDLLSSTYMIRQLPPWFENIKKRQVKSPKIYFRDSGIYHTLMGINDFSALQFNPKLGISWEGFALEEVIRHFDIQEGEAYFWSAYGRAELDLLIIKNGKRLGFEIKYTDKPTITRSMLTAQKDLAIDQIMVIHGGKETFPLADNIIAAGLEGLTELVWP